MLSDHCQHQLTRLQPAAVPAAEEPALLELQSEPAAVAVAEQPGAVEQPVAEQLAVVVAEQPAVVAAEQPAERAAGTAAADIVLDFAVHIVVAAASMAAVHTAPAVLAFELALEP